MNNPIETPAIRYSKVNGWEAYILTFFGGDLVSEFCIGYFDTEADAVDALILEG